MAPPPEYDKEPKAPDKSATNISCDNTMALHNLVNDQQTISDSKSSSTAASADVENNKLVETLDDGQLRALLDEAITYKCPKDREGKSSLFKELLEEVEQDEQASEAAARTITVNRSVNRACASGRGSRSRRALPHSNSLQDLVAALAAEPAPRRHHRAPPAPAPAPVSARAIHGGSLPSGVDTSFLLSDEPARGAGYLATVRCVNPPPLAERRVSTDASCNELDSLNRRSKPAFPMTYTARATLEIGSGAVSSGRAVTTTTASNQVRTKPARHHHPRFLPSLPLNNRRTAPTAGPPERLYPQKRLYYPMRFKRRKKIWLSDGDEFHVTNEIDNANGRNFHSSFDSEIDTVIGNTDRIEISEPMNSPNTDINVIREESSSNTDSDTEPGHIIDDNIDPNQFKLLSALFPKMSCDKDANKGGGSKTKNKNMKKPRGPKPKVTAKCQQDLNKEATIISKAPNAEVIPCLQEIDKIKILATTTNNTPKRDAKPANTGTKMSKGKEKKNLLNPTKDMKHKVGGFATNKKDAKLAYVTGSETTVSKNKDDNQNSTNPDSIAWKININNWYCGLENYYLDSYCNEEEYSSHPALFNDPQRPKQFKKTKFLPRKRQAQSNKSIGNSRNQTGDPRNASSKIEKTEVLPRKQQAQSNKNIGYSRNQSGDPPNASSNIEKTEVLPRKQQAQSNKNIAKSRNQNDDPPNASSNILHQNISRSEDTYDWTKFYPSQAALRFPLKSASHMKKKAKNTINYNKTTVQQCENRTVPSSAYAQKYRNEENIRWVLNNHIEPVGEPVDTDYFEDVCDYDYLERSRREYRKRIGKFLVAPKLDDMTNPRNVRSMSIGKPISSFDEFDISGDNDIIFETEDNKGNEDNKLPAVNSPTNGKNDQDVLTSFDKFAMSSTDETVIDRKNDIDSHLVEVNSPCQVEEDKYVLASSCDSFKMQEGLEEFYDSKDVLANISIRSSTPIPEQNNSSAMELSNLIVVEKDNKVASSESCSQLEIMPVEKDTEVASSESKSQQEFASIEKDSEVASSEGNSQLEGASVEKDTEVTSSESNSYLEGTSLIGSDKLKKGTVIPFVNQPDSVSIDNNGHLCSSSQEKDPSSEEEKVNLPPQQAHTCTKFIKKDSIQNNDTFNQEQYVELVDMSSHTHEIKERIRDKDKKTINYDNFSGGCEDIPLTKTSDEHQKIRKSDAAFENGVELVDMSLNSLKTGDLNLENVKKITILDECSNKPENNSFSKYLEEQKRLFRTLEDSNLVDNTQEHSLVSNVSSFKSSEKVHNSEKGQLFKCNDENIEEEICKESQEVMPNITLNIGDLAANCKVLVIKKNDQGQLVLTLPEMFLSDSSIRKSNQKAIEFNCEEKTNNILHCLLGQQQNDNNRLNIEKSKLKKKKNSMLEKSKLETANKKALKALMFENPSQSIRHDQSMSTSTVSIEEVDSAIPFSCITTPEVVASCNTTSSTSQSAVAVDPKPLQLASSYRAVASLVGEPPPSPAAPAPRAATPPPPLSPHRAAAAAHLLAPRTPDQPRGVVTSSFNGLPLSRPNYGSTGNTTQDEYKKSIDENGNSVQGFSSPLSGSSQHKKPRRKKCSKNETVIKSHQIDGYQGNKDLNEVLRFIESAADTNRAGKLGRAKHRDDGDDKGGKKRSGTRKDKESKMKRATSMEELSLSRMEDLTDKPSPPARAPRHSDQGKAERRSWGDDARDSTTRFFREEPLDVAAVPDTEFQTVTKKRKPRRRADEPPDPPDQAAGDPGPRARATEPRARRVSAPPSDRSNDSNDDMDSVHSLPADAVVGRATAPAPAPISYADIARTRHNIPDLIESCNFYSEPERDRSEKERVLPSTETPLAPIPAPGDVDGYPALEPRGRRTTPASKPQQTPLPRRDIRKVERTESVRNNCTHVGVEAGEAVETGETGETAESPAEWPAEWPAPDVVSDRRPAVILLDAADARDMDGVTFGFDINETLLNGPPRRARCDLLRDALEGATPPDSNGAAPPDLPGGGGGGVAVGGACGALRYVPPAPPADTLHLHQIIDYVGAAWEDVVRLGAGKVHYYSE